MNRLYNAVKGTTATRIVDDGDVIDLGNRHSEFVHTPGHSPGGIALWEAASGVLFSADIVYAGEPIEDTYHSNATDYIASMEHLLGLPVNVVHGDHFLSYGRDRHREIINDWLVGKTG